MRMLIVDDEPICRKILEAILQPFGECELASDGQEAFDKYCQAIDDGRPFDLITLDVMMPEVSGTECLHSIRAHEIEELKISEEQQVKIIVTTALDDPQTIYDAHSGGCTQYLVKPLSKKRILQALRSMELVESGEAL